MNRWVDKYPVHDAGSTALRKVIRDALITVQIPLNRMAVAVSGGPDSAVMAVQLALLAQELGSCPHVFHIHHGLQAPADQWRDQVHNLAHILQLPCHSRRVSVETGSGAGTEAAARDARYQALHAMARQAGVQGVFLAHHRDDQAETVLLRLLRGSGPTGLAAMAPQTVRNGLSYIRPWLDVDRATIMQHMQLFLMASGWRAVYDPSNYDDRYTRSALRERLAPILDQRWPGWQGILARHARLTAQTNDVLDEVAISDFATLEPSVDNTSFSLQRWRSLSPARQAHLIRYWLRQQGCQSPTEARLNDLLRQLRGLHALGHDRHMQVKHGNVWICCHRGRVYLTTGLH